MISEVPRRVINILTPVCGTWCFTISGWLMFRKIDLKKSLSLCLEKKDKALERCIVINSLVALLSFLWLILMNKGVFTLCGDYNAQAIPFSIGMHKAILNGQSWSWGIDLGTQTVGAYSFYGLGSISFWITMLFPVSATPCVMGWLYILKYIAAGITSFLYIRQFTRNDNYAVIGSTLYAFSGYQAVNLEFYTFHDVTILFPLLLLEFDRMMKSGKCRLRDGKPFILVTALSCLNSYFFFVGQVVFLLLYFFLRYGEKNLKLTLRNLLLCGIAGLWGVMIAGILFFPNILFISGNKRSSVQLLLSQLFPEPKMLLYLLKGFLFPGEAMYDSSAVYNQRWTSTSAYLPLIGMSGVLAYLHQKRRDWLSRMLIILIAAAFSPLLTSAFLLFTEANQRWWYMLILLMASASAIVLEQRSGEKNNDVLKTAVFVNMAVLVVYYLALNLLKWSDSEKSLVCHRGFFFLIFAVSLAGLLILRRLSSCARHYCLSVTAWTAVFALLTTAYVLGYYRFADGIRETCTQKIRLYSQLEPIDDQYRYIDENMMLYSEGASGLRIFSSTVSDSIVHFDSLFDFYKQARRLDKTSYAGLAELFGGKYDVTTDPEGRTPLRTYPVDGKNYYVVERNACPIGFAVDQVITERDLKKIDVSERGLVLLRAAVIQPDDRKSVSDLAPCVSYRDALNAIQTDLETARTASAGNSHLDPSDNAGLVFVSDQEGYSPSGREADNLSKSSPGKKVDLTDDELQEVAAERVASDSNRAVKNFRRTSDGFVCDSDYSSDSLVYFSVPNDSGWKAFIDGQQTEIINSGGMMLIRVPAGTHRISFRYTTPGLSAGTAVSLISLCALILYALSDWEKRRRAALRRSFASCNR